MNPHGGMVTETDKRNVKISAFVLIGIGAIIFIFDLIFLIATALWVLIWPSIYCLAGLLGLYGVYSGYASRLLLYQIALVFLVVMNVGIIILFITLIGLVISGCSSNNCNQSAYNLVLAFLFISLAITGAIIVMLVVCFKFVTRYKQNQLAIEYSQRHIPLVS